MVFTTYHIAPNAAPDDTWFTREDAICDDTWHSTEINHLTRAGRHFKPPHLVRDQPDPSQEPPLPVELPEEEKEDLVLKQLKKLQANVSIWGLLVASHKHRQAVLNALNKLNVSVDTSPEQLVGLITPTQSQDVISFTSKDLPPGGFDHNRPLHMGKWIPVVLVDNGSALNVCSLRTMQCLGINPSEMTPSKQGIRAYDNTKREVLGVIILPVTIGPLKNDIQFQVLDVNTSFNLLLGRDRKSVV